MAQLYWCPCIVVGAARYYLPPLMKIKDSWGQQVNILNPPYANKAFIADVYPNQSCRISLEMLSPAIGANKARKVLDWIQNIRANLMGKTFSLYLFNDRGYENCALASSDHEIPSGRLSYLDAGLEIVSESGCTDTLPTLTFPGGYDVDYPYANLVGIPDGDTSSGGGNSVIQQPRQVMNGIFAGGQYSPTPNGNEHVYIVGGAPGSIWTVDLLQITSAQNFDAASETSVTVSVSPPSMPGADAQAEVDETETASTATAVSMTTTAGSALYVYIDTAGGHSDVQYQLQLRG